MTMTEGRPRDVDVVVIGAGFSGLYMLHRLRGLGLSARVFERGDDVGGTWYWNRYPGARCDVESMQYSFSFDDALQQSWHWPEKFSAQPDILAYARHVAARFDLRRHIDFETSVVRAHFDEALQRWRVTTDRDEHLLASHVVLATGCISTAQVPAIDGIESFRGETYHTGRWPHAPVDFAGQRVAVIGTGSSGIQSIPEIARQAAHLTVFQRTPHYSLPAQNVPMSQAYERSWKDDYTSLRAEMRYSHHGSLKDLNDVPALSVSEAQRRAVYQTRWDIGGTGFLGAFNDLLTSAEANETAADFVRERVRAIVTDRTTAEVLCPRGYPIGTKRICIDSGYYQTFNRDNVGLVDIRSHGIERITGQGIIAGGQAHTFDSIVFATGFDAMTGTALAIDLRGRGGLRLADKWRGGPRTYLGLMCESFPNLYLITGPGSPSVKSNMLMSIEQHVDFVADAIDYLRNASLASIEPEREAEDEWVDHVQEVANATLFPRANSWYMGANIPGKPRLFMPYIGGLGRYRRICEDVVGAGYRGLRVAPYHAAATAAQ